MARRSPLETAQALTARIAALEAERLAVIAKAVADGATWAEIGRALGVTAQAVHKRYRWLHYSPVTRETWHEPPLPELNRSRKARTPPA